MRPPIPVGEREPGENDVVFTQFKMPNGRREVVWVARSPETASLARTIEQAGYHFDIEMLSDLQTISMTVDKDAPTTDEDEQPIAHELVVNGPAVLDAVDRLITAAGKRIAEVVTR